jgi:hypothetical protein
MPAEICLHPLGVPEKEQQNKNEYSGAKSIGTQQKVQEHNDIYIYVTQSGKNDTCYMHLYYDGATETSMYCYSDKMYQTLLLQKQVLFDLL